jgi:hypothetical protein
MCATRVHSSIPAGRMPIGLLVGNAKRVLERVRYEPPAGESKSTGYLDRIVTVPGVITDSEYANPEHVWGDEGPINDRQGR